jgi:glycosyltransferase involved in cell wall biosynthesis
VLRRTWDVSVLGINYRGDPHPYPYPIYPALVPGADLFGVRRAPEIIRKIKADLVVIQNDPWNIPAYVESIGQLEGSRPKLVGALAVDGKNCRGRAFLNGLDYAIFWTRFAQLEAIQGGMTIPSGVAPLGVDLNIYRPHPREQAREWLGLPERCREAFVVGNVNRNQPRKRLDLTIAYFAEWVRSYRVTDAYLYLHVAPTGDFGIDCNQLAVYHGLGNPENPRLILCEPEVYRGASEEQLAWTYSAFDTQISTTQGEGWGLTTMEGMACGVPQIVPRWSALEEWTRPAAILIPCTSTAITLKRINVIGGIADRQETIRALDALYRNPELRAAHTALGLELVRQDCYRWENIGQRFAEEIERAYA